MKTRRKMGAVHLESKLNVSAKKSNVKEVTTNSSDKNSLQISVPTTLAGIILLLRTSCFLSHRWKISAITTLRSKLYQLMAQKFAAVGFQRTFPSRKAPRADFFGTILAANPEDRDETWRATLLSSSPQRHRHNFWLRRLRRLRVLPVPVPTQPRPARKFPSFF